MREYLEAIRWWSHLVAQFHKYASVLFPLIQPTTTVIVCRVGVERMLLGAF